MNIPLNDYWIMASGTTFSTSFCTYNIPHKILKYNNKSSRIDRSYISYKENIVIFFVKYQFANLEIIVCWTPEKPEHIKRFHFQLNNREEINLDIIGAPCKIRPAKIGSNQARVTLYQRNYKVKLEATMCKATE